MTWIKMLGESDDPIVRQLAEYRQRTHGYFPNVLQAMTLKPETLRRLLRFQDTMTFGGSSLGRRWEELISFRVSAVNTCTYWTVSHGEFLRKALDEDVATVKQVQRDPAQADTLTDQEKRMLAFVEKLTRAPWTMARADVEGLRAGGFDDLQILEIVQLTAWFNFMTRVADALGVEVEDWREGWRRELLPDRAAAEKATP